MSTQFTRKSSDQRTVDRGMTLIELVVVTTLVGVIAVVLAGAFSVVVRASPSNTNRADDSRTMLGLTTYLPEDINSTPSAGFDFSKTAASGCPGAADPGVSVVRLQWTELSTSYVANYRYEPSGGGYVLARYGCTLSAGTTSRRVLTSTMPAIDESTWMPGDAPAEVTPILEATLVVGLTIELTSISNDVFVVEGRTNNPSEVLPPPAGGGGSGGSGSTNTAPVATDVIAQVLPIVASSVALNASDVDTDPLTATIAPGPYTSITGDWTISLSGLDLTVQPPATAPDGESVSFGYSVDDARGGTASATVTITVGAAANTAPVANNASATVDERTSASITVPISDAEGDAMTVTLGTVDPSVTVTVSSVSGTAVVFGVYATGAAVSPTFQFVVSDGTASSTATVNLTVVKCVPGSPGPALVTVDRRNGNADHKKTIDSAAVFTLPYAGPCEGRITFEFRRDLRVGGTVQQMVPPCASGLCTVTFAKYGGDWYPPDGLLTTTHTWTHTFRLDNTSAISPALNMRINGA